MRRLVLLLLLPLAACATQRQQCDRAATRDLSVVSALITETEQNIARGYAIQREERIRPTVQFCLGSRQEGNRTVTSGLVFCDTFETETIETPVAIDLKAEKAKLDGLRAKQVELHRLASIQLAACAAQYPEN